MTLIPAHRRYRVLYTVILFLMCLPVSLFAADPEIFTLKLSQSTEECDFWTAPPSERIVKTNAVPDTIGAYIQIYAAKNEFEPFLLVVNPDSTFTSDVTIGDFGSGITVELFQVKYVDVTTASDSLGTTGPYPDPLWPLDNGDSLTFNAHENTPLWFSVKVDKTVEAGDYSTTVTVNSVSIPVRLHVFDFAIPDELHVKSQMNVSFDTLRIRYGVSGTGSEFWSFEDMVKQFFMDHRLTPTAVLWPGSLMQSGLEPYVAYGCDTHAITDENGIWGFEIPAERYLGGTGLLDGQFSEAFNGGTGFPSFAAASYTNSDPSMDHRPSGMCGQTLTATDWYTSDNPASAYNVAFLEYVSALESYLDTLGYLDKAYYTMAFGPVDEDDMDAIAWYSELVKSAAPDLDLMVYGPPEPGIYDHDLYTGAKVDIWVTLFDEFDSSLALVRDADFNEESWIYYYLQSKPPYANPITLDHPGIESKLTGWLLWKYRIRGLTYYAMNNWGTNPWESPLTNWQNGTMFLIYPPSETNADIVYNSNGNRLVPSIRLELMRDSLEDYEYFYVLNNNARPLAGVANDADTQVNKLVSGKSGFSRDSEYMYNLRKLIGMANGGETDTVDDLVPVAGHDREKGNYYINFQDPAGEPLYDPLVVNGKTYMKIGWDSYDQTKGYGWYGEMSDAFYSYLDLGSDPNALQQSILYDDWGRIKTFEFDVPAATYDVTVSVGWQGHAYEHNNITVEGVRFFDDEGNDNGYLLETRRVRVYDNKLTMEMGIDGEYTMLNYMEVEFVDTTAPTITLIGEATITLTVGDTYTDLGATATDDTDGDLTAAIIVDISQVNTDVAGTYNVTYTVTDATGNTARATRTIVVNKKGGSGGGGGCFIFSLY